MTIVELTIANKVPTVRAEAELGDGCGDCGVVVVVGLVPPVTLIASFMPL